jgi:hypothetical protein
VWTPDKVYRYVDGLLIRGTDFVYSSPGQAQFIASLACGSVSAGLIPTSLGEFPMALSIKHFKIWGS